MNGEEMKLLTEHVIEHIKTFYRPEEYCEQYYNIKWDCMMFITGYITELNIKVYPKMIVDIINKAYDSLF